MKLIVPTKYAWAEEDDRLMEMRAAGKVHVFHVRGSEGSTGAFKARMPAAIWAASARSQGLVSLR